MKPDNDTAIRKRSQINKANRTMFLWIALASALVGIALVLGIFMVQKLLFNEQVLAAKQETLNILAANNAVVDDLKNEVRALDANEDLAKAKANEDDQAIQVILDALPSEANSLALGASLQNVLLAGIEGLTIESLQVDPVVGIETLTDGSVVDAADSGVANAITFQFTVSGSQDALKQVLTNLERSIRTIEVTSLRIETQQDGPIMTVQARAFYEPARVVELGERTIKP